jgi:hypothetical protein
LCIWAAWRNKKYSYFDDKVKTEWVTAILNHKKSEQVFEFLEETHLSGCSVRELLDQFLKGEKDDGWHVQTMVTGCSYSKVERGVAIKKVDANSSSVFIGLSESAFFAEVLRGNDEFPLIIANNQMR